MSTIAEPNHVATQAQTPIRAQDILNVLLSKVIGTYRWHRSRRAMMEMSDWQRRDVGLEGVDLRSETEIVIAARRNLELGLPTEWR